MLGFLSHEVILLCFSPLVEEKLALELEAMDRINRAQITVSSNQLLLTGVP